jgi:hypothetical protein
MVFPGGGMGPDLDKDRVPGWKAHWDWDPAWSRRFGLVQLRVDNRYQVRIEGPAEVDRVRKIYGILVRAGGKAVLVGPSSTVTPDLGLVEADVPQGRRPVDVLKEAALARAGAELGRHWLMFNLQCTPLAGGEPFYEGIFLAEVESLAETVPDPAFTRRTVLTRDLLSTVRGRYYEIAEPLVMAIDRYVQYRALVEKQQHEEAEATSG